MSTGYFPHTVRGQLSPFLILSLAAHLAALLFLSPSPPHEKRLERLIPVDIIELPPTPRGEAVAPPKVERYAQRSQKVERETVPSVNVAPVTPPVVKTPGIAAGGKTGSQETPFLERTEDGKKMTDVLSGPGETVSDKTGAQNSTGPFAQGEQPPALYPTRERLAKLSEDYEKTAPKAEKGKILALNTTEHRYWYYMDGIKRKIELQWDYPDVAIRKGQQGKLLVVFSIGRDGAIRTVKLVTGSGYPMLDNAALTAIKLAAPFYPFPEEYELDDITIQAHFEYILNPVVRSN